MAADMSYQVFRRFSQLRTRLLLLKQDKLAALEKDLEEIDRDENNEIYLQSYRADENLKRKTIIEEIGTHLSDYGALPSLFPLVP